MPMPGHLLDEDHDRMDLHFEHTFDLIRSGQLSRPGFVERMAYLITAVDLDAYDEVRRCFQPRREAAQPPHSEAIVVPYRRRAAR